jgi:hypothetical protein
MAKEAVLSVVRSRRTHLREEDVRSHLQGCHDSGQSLSAYCKQHSLPYKRLLWWRRRLEGADTERPPHGAFVEVEVKRTPARSSRGSARRWAKGGEGTIIVRMRNGHTVRIVGDVEHNKLEKILQIVGRVAC